MANTGSSDFHVEYMDVTQHWHPQSQPYAGGDHLLTALYDGWRMGDTVFYEEHWFAGMRYVTVYHFELTRDDESMTMPVIYTPYLTRLMRQTDAQVMTKEQRKRGREKSTRRDIGERGPS